MKLTSWPSQVTPVQQSQQTPLSLLETEINFDFKDFRQCLTLCLGLLINQYWKSMPGSTPSAWQFLSAWKMPNFGDNLGTENRQSSHFRKGRYSFMYRHWWIQHFIELERLLLYSKKSATTHYSESNKSSSQPHTPFIYFNIIFSFKQKSLNGLSVWGLFIKII